MEFLLYKHRTLWYNDLQLYHRVPQRNHANSQKLVAQFLLIFLFSSLLSSEAQSQHTQLNFKDKLSGQVVEFAGIRIQQIEGGREAHIISDESGKASPDFPHPLVIHVSCLGFRNFTDTLPEP